MLDAFLSMIPFHPKAASAKTLMAAPGLVRSRTMAVAVVGLCGVSQGGYGLTMLENMIN